MKILSLRSVAILLLLSIAFAACKKSQNLEKIAENQNVENISGRTGVIDYYVIWGKINSSGRGYNIKFTNDSIVYHISNDLTTFGINTIASSNFPINVIVTSNPDNAESNNYVIIMSLKINK